MKNQSNFLYENDHCVTMSVSLGEGESHSLEDNRTKLGKNSVIDSLLDILPPARQVRRISEDSSASIILNTPTFACFVLFFAFSENVNVG